MLVHEAGETHPLEAARAVGRPAETRPKQDKHDKRYVIFEGHTRVFGMAFGKCKVGAAARESTARQLL
jgi:hypothetical protein